MPSAHFQCLKVSVELSAIGDGFRCPIHSGSNSRDGSMAGVCDCVKERVSFIM